MATPTMLEAVVSPTTTVAIHTVPIPSPGASELLIRVMVAGSNPKDWKRPHWQSEGSNSGDDMAGTVVAAGRDVQHLFQPGTRVAALHTLGGPHGAFAEYAVASADLAFALPDWVSFEQAATMPLALLTAATGLFLRQGLPLPWGDRDPAGPPSHAGKLDSKTPFERGLEAKAGARRVVGGPPLVIYGAASAVGAFAVQLASAANAGPLICIAGKGMSFVETLVDKEAGDVVLDYRVGDDALVAGLRSALGGERVLMRAFDCITGHGSYSNLGQVLAPGAQLTTVHRASMMPHGRFVGVEENVRLTESYVADVPLWFPRFGAVCMALFEHGLREGWLKPHPHEVVPGGLRGVEVGLRNLREGKASAIKYVFRISETAELAT